MSKTLKQTMVSGTVVCPFSANCYRLDPILVPNLACRLVDIGCVNHQSKMKKSIVIENQ
jgi:hypothetical protein